MADRDVRRLLEGSGYSQISLDRIDADIFVGRDLDQAIEFQLALGPAGEVYREAGDEAVEVARANTRSAQGRTGAVLDVRQRHDGAPARGR